MITPQIVPISDLRIRHTEVLALLEQGPVFLAQRSKATAVLVSVGEWNAIDNQLKRLQQLELLTEAKHSKARVERTEIACFTPAHAGRSRRTDITSAVARAANFQQIDQRSPTRRTKP